MPTELTLDESDVLAWVNEYTQPTKPIKDEELSQILHFSLIWNLFERNACCKEANPVNIRKAVEKASGVGKLSSATFNVYLNYFQSRSQRDGMSINGYLDALKIKNIDRNHVLNVLNGNLVDVNNVVLALLLIANRIRNNLFHGEKDLAELYTQSELFRVINSLLINYLNCTKDVT